MNCIQWVTAIAVAFTVVTQVNAQEVPSGVVMFNFADAKWEKTPAGGEVAKIYGDQSKPGPYSFLTKPRPVLGPPSQPHTHPDTRTYTVISGTWYVGFGNKFDESKLIALKQGSFYTEPAGVAHYVVIKDEGVIVQISGTGPSRLIPVDQATQK
jgi:mannose-6-phosphate isomerase-like protein (cupin superfamily)